jgi:hypothetical protein
MITNAADHADPGQACGPGAPDWHEVVRGPPEILDIVDGPERLGAVSSDRAVPRVSWDELVAMTPEVIRQTLPMVPWKIDKLWALELPVQRVAVGDLAWLLDLPLWQKNGTRFQVSPAQVRADPGRFPDHLRRAMASDLEQPIHVVKHNGRLSSWTDTTGS